MSARKPAISYVVHFEGGMISESMSASSVRSLIESGTVTSAAFKYFVEVTGPRTHVHQADSAASDARIRRCLAAALTV